MGLCEFTSLEKGSKCDSCGYELTRSYEGRFIRECGAKERTRTAADHLECAHIGTNTRRHVQMLATRCCAGAKLTVIFKCDIHGKCAPLSHVETLKNPAVKACCGCVEYEAREEAAASG